PSPPTVTVPSGGAVSDSAITSAVTDAGKGAEISLNASASTSVTLGGAAAAAVVENGSALNVTVKGGGALTVQPDVLQALNLKAADKLSVGMTTAASTTPNAIAFEVNLAVNGAAVHTLGGKMTLDFPMDAAWNGKTVILEHRHADGTVTYTEAVVKDGKATTIVTDLSTFTVRLSSDMPAAAFTDLKAEDWSFGGIAYAVEKGLFAGTSATTFAPNSPMTRQQMWMVLARLSGQTPADMDAAKTWAISNQISDGSNPTAAVTRQQFVTLLWRTVGSPAASKDLSAYTDAASVEAYAKTAFAWAVGSGVVSGTSAATLSPTGTASRAQIAVILSRYGQQAFK
ncbi:S-layer homology domain-containing protein, partial [Oscillibacter sp.]|uniref:S-layer homology domain-containing protein n=1 Tax=Oscillibacter sp. TaxID=1945593 RepID=UPI0028A0D824